MCTVRSHSGCSTNGNERNGNSATTSLVVVLAAEFTREATRKSIRASLPHSRFISTPNVKPADTLLCHLIESTALCAANNGWEFCSSARQWRDKRRKPTAPPRFQTSLSLALALRASSRLPFHFQRNYCKCGANSGG